MSVWPHRQEPQTCPALRHIRLVRVPRPDLSAAAGWAERGGFVAGILVARPLRAHQGWIAFAHACGVAQENPRGLPRELIRKWRRCSVDAPAASSWPSRGGGGGCRFLVRLEPRQRRCRVSRCSVAEKRAGRMTGLQPPRPLWQTGPPTPGSAPLRRAPHSSRVKACRGAGFLGAVRRVLPSISRGSGRVAGRGCPVDGAGCETIRGRPGSTGSPFGHGAMCVRRSPLRR